MTCASCKFSQRIIAYRVDADTMDDHPTRVNARLCVWADMHPERFIDAPRWLTRDLPVLHGHLIEDAENCPAWEAAP